MPIGKCGKIIFFPHIIQIVRALWRQPVILNNHIPGFKIPLFLAQQRVARLPLGIVCTGFWEECAANLRIVVVPFGKKQIDRIALKIVLQQKLRQTQ